VCRFFEPPQANEFVFLRTSEEKVNQILSLKEKLAILDTKAKKLLELYYKLGRENIQKSSDIKDMEKLNAGYSKQLAELEKSWQAKYFDW
jgi:hypothetical protein